MNGVIKDTQPLFKEGYVETAKSSISANGYLSQNTTVPSYPGYTFVGVTGIYKSHAQLRLSQCLKISDTQVYTLMGSSQALSNVYFALKLLYIKNAQFEYV